MGKKKKITKNNYGYLFIAPYFIAFLIFGVYPIVYSFYLSFTKWSGGVESPKFVAFTNFKRLIHDTVFYKSIGNTILMWTVCIIPQIIFALFLAVVLTNRKLKGKELFRGIYYLPNLVTMASVSILFGFILDWKTGALNAILINLHLIKEPIQWLQNIGATRFAVSFINWWMWFGYSMIIFMAGVKAISADLFEAAIVDGANKWQTFKNITLPNLRPTMIYMVITSMIGGMTMFDIPYVLTNGDGSPQGSILTVVMYLYNQSFRNYNYGYGATITVGLFVLLLVAVAFAYKLMTKNSLYE